VGFGTYASLLGGALTDTESPKSPNVISTFRSLYPSD
jgi:hypothetical protein